MQADAIQRVSNAIHDVLASALSAANVSGGVFIGPLDDPNASGAALVMFLFRIVPTPDLRSSDHVTVSNDPVPVPVTYRNSLPVKFAPVKSVARRSALSRFIPAIFTPRRSAPRQSTRFGAPCLSLMLMLRHHRHFRVCMRMLYRRPISSP